MQTVEVEIQGPQWRLTLPEEEALKQRQVCCRKEGLETLLRLARRRSGRTLSVYFDVSRAEDRQSAVELTVCMADKGWAVCLLGLRRGSGGVAAAS